jgi:hypothetical protein
VCGQVFATLFPRPKTPPILRAMHPDNDDRNDARRAEHGSRDAELRREGEAGRAADKKRAKKSKDPAKPTRAKANRPDFAPTSPELEKLLNPGIAGGTAGPGPSTGIRPPADNSKDRRADFSAAHTARASTQGFGEAPQRAYTEGDKTPLAGIDRELAQALGFGPEEAPSLPPDQVRGRLSPASGGGDRSTWRGGKNPQRALSVMAAR